MKAIVINFRLHGFPFLVTALLAAGAVPATTSSSHASIEGERAAMDKIQVPTRASIGSGEYTCAPAHVELMKERQHRIAEAATVEEARALAIGPARAARTAVAVAGTVVPWSKALADAGQRLEGFEDRIQRSSTQREVAVEFGRLVDVDSRGELIQLADLDAGPSVRGPGRCYYTTGEIIAIVFGFILFIVPGVVLLFVLC
ncbi:MAG TPA: hypothetical protein VEC57_19960 [Candidatus Limnocylindrales bacterium]|nr:hypothetical protein [Candidatus Limnocylindrales bacterium]